MRPTNHPLTLDDELDGANGWAEDGFSPPFSFVKVGVKITCGSVVLVFRIGARDGGT